LYIIQVDTCCIDKSSSAELSEAINSMWRWYRESTACYAYLDDVDRSDHTADANLAESKWFTRGWTLQELLAPSNLIFFDSIWTRIGVRDELATEISDITKIHRYYLGKDPSSIERASIAERMSWASARETTRPEDVAYCLLGILNISMPLLYGEGKRAFHRLQEEVMKQSDDQSIFAWSSLAFGGNDGLLAQSPAEFHGCGNIVRSINPSNIEPFSVTNRGLRIALPLLKRNNQTLAGLNCRFAHDFFSDLSIPLEQMDNGHQYRRAHGDVQAIPISDWRRAKIHSIYAKTTLTEFRTRSDPKEGSIIIRNLPDGFKIVDVLPHKFWSPESRTTDESLPGIFPRGSDDPILVIVETRPFQVIAFMISSRKDNLFYESSSEARLLPVEAIKYLNPSQLYHHWKSRKLSVLPKSQKTLLGVTLIRATNQLIRGRKLTFIDVLVVNSRYQVYVESIEYMRSLPRSASYQITRALNWLFESDRKPPNEMVYYYSSSKVSGISNLLITGVFCLLLVAPMLSMYRLSTVRRVDSSHVITVVIAFMLPFAAALSLLTRARRHEVFAASAAYCAVLVVFVGSINLA
jgi:hypothetical protein